MLAPLESPWMTVVAGILILAAVLVGRLHVVRLQRSLLAEKEIQRSLFRHNIDAVAAVDHRGVIKRTNPSLTELTGFPPEALIGRSFVELAVSSQRQQVETVLSSIVRGTRRTITTMIRRAGGRTLEVELSSVPIVTGGKIREAYQIVRDITDRTELERELSNRALHDYLTELPNRALFTDRLHHALERAQRDAGRIALLYVDLDKFKLVNDRAGHAVGDALLQEVAARLATVVRGGDTVARIGGDEFGVLLEDVKETADARATAERIVSLVRAPMTIEGKEVQVGASVGVAVSSEETAGPEELVQQADLAMYEAKRRGGFGSKLYRSDMAELRSDSQVELEGELRRGIERDELTVMYQPIVDIIESQIVGLEVLARWNHPRHGILLPSTFIPMAEKSSLIAEVDRWVLERGLYQAQELFKTIDAESPLFLSVNLSGRHFAEYDLIDAISSIILDAEFDPENIQLEITESVAGGDPDTVRRLKTLGVKIAIDDFGTGFSSLGYVRDLEVDVLKVDKSFVLGLGADPASVAIIRTIITLAEMLDMGVIIEGIEDAEQLGHLKDLGGRLVQGYYFGRPVEFESVPAMLHEGVTAQDYHAAPVNDTAYLYHPDDVPGRAESELRPYLPVMGSASRRRRADPGVSPAADRVSGRGSLE
jgi:Amt family ammonium transporter